MKLIRKLFPARRRTRVLLEGTNARMRQVLAHTYQPRPYRPIPESSWLRIPGGYKIGSRT